MKQTRFREIEEVTYVCPVCFEKAENCICKTFPQDYTICIDKNLEKALKILNQTGYKTLYSCEGHYAEVYVLIQGKVKTCPTGFKKENFRGNTKIFYLFKETDQVEKVKKEKIKNLEEWAENLKERKNA
jgi:hypothetical protein